MIRIVLGMLMYFKVDERDNKGGRKDREIELGKRFMERRMEHDEHIKVFTEGNNFISSKTTYVFLLQLSLL